MKTKEAKHVVDYYLMTIAYVIWLSKSSSCMMVVADAAEGL